MYNFFWNSKKHNLLDNQLNSQEKLGILDIEAQLNCIKTKWIVIKCHQCFLERWHDELIEVNSEF